MALRSYGLCAYGPHSYGLYSYGLSRDSYGYTHCSKGNTDRSGPQNVRPCLRHTAHIAVQFSSVHNTLCGRARVHTHSYMRTVGLYIQAQLPESFGNLSALKKLYLEGCTGLVHTSRTKCTPMPACMYSTHHILRYYLCPPKPKGLAVCRVLHGTTCNPITYACAVCIIYSGVSTNAHTNTRARPHEHAHACAHTQPHAYLSAWTFRFSYCRASAPWLVQSWPMKSVPM